MAETILRAILTYKVGLGAVSKAGYRWQNMSNCVTWMDESADNILVISGCNLNGGASDRFLPDYARPFVVYRERNRNRCFLLRLDLENPQEPKGGNLTAEQAATTAAEAIHDMGRTRAPVANPAVL